MAAVVTTRVAGVIVVYKPEAPQLNKLIAALKRECEAVYVMDNGGGAAAIERGIKVDPKLRIIDMRGNTGLGYALNAAFDLVEESGLSYATTFDQDSEPAAGQIRNLLDALEAILATGSQVAAVGPRIVDSRGARPVEHSFMRRAVGWPRAVRCEPGRKYVAADFLITSGSLISMNAYRRVGKFDAGLFVDYTDFDWCFRAMKMGYRLMGICGVTMKHELSAGESQKIFGMNILRYGPVRRYYYARNIVLLAGRSHVSFGWKIRLLSGLASRLLFLPLATRFAAGWSRDWRMMCIGIAHGVQRRDGALPVDYP